MSVWIGQEQDEVWLDYKQAAALVKRSEMSVRRWARAGMPMKLVDGKRYVERAVLMSWFRRSLTNSPAHFYRMRKMRQEDGLPEPEDKPDWWARMADRSHVEELEVEAEPAPAPVVDPLASLKPLKAGLEFEQLQAALRKVEAPCEDREEFTRDTIFTFEFDAMTRMCAHCPVRSLCLAFAEVERPAFGFWAGRYWKASAARVSSTHGG